MREERKTEIDRQTAIRSYIEIHVDVHIDRHVDRYIEKWTDIEKEK